MEYKIIQRDQVPICPVDASGCFTAEVVDFAGQYVKVSGLPETVFVDAVADDPWFDGSTDVRFSV